MTDTLFDQLPISQEILQALHKKSYYHATTIQAEAIQPLMDWKDVIAKAPTGTGKTFAFGIPIIEHIDEGDESVQALILAPTRELAIQIGDELRMLLEFKKGIRVSVLYGGQKIDTQIKSLKRKPQIIVATPGRLMDHYKRKTVHLNSVKTLILDEADRMLDMGFIKEVTAIIQLLKNRVNMGLFSATISQEVMTISWKYQRDEVEITVLAEAEDKPSIEQFSIEVSGYDKYEAILKLIKAEGFERMIIFCNMKVTVDRVYEYLKGKDFTVDCLHGDIKQSTRESVMNRFKAGNLNVLIATDVASRGIDVFDVDCVLNFDVPEENEYYVHRIGRTGRAKREGVSYSFVGSILDQGKLDEISKFCGYTINKVQFTDDGSLEQAPEKKPVKKSKRRF